jgi:hypothetical protein
MSKVYKKTEKENVCGKEKTIYELDDEKYINQKGKKGEVYIEVKKYVEKKKAKGECLNPLLDRRLQILNKIWKKSSAVKEVVNTSSERRRASAARRASSERRRASAARRAREENVLNITNSSSFKLSPGRSRTPVIVQAPRRFTLSETRISNKPASSIKKQCKVNCKKDGKVCNTKTGRCIKSKKEKSVIVKKAKLEVFAERPCKQDCTALNKICKVSTRRCVNPPKAKPKVTAANFKPCKKECGEGRRCNFLSGRCIKQK